MQKTVGGGKRMKKFIEKENDNSCILTALPYFL